MVQHIKQTYFFILFIFGSIGSYANMASPNIPGSTISEAYSSRHLDIVHEHIKIIHIDAYQAKFTIIYTINSDHSAWSIPLIFDTMTDRYSDNRTFKVWVDGHEVTVSEIPSTYENKNALLWMDSLDYNISYLQQDVPNLIGLKYFEADLPEGMHTIKVEYTAFAGQELWKPIKRFNYKYNLKPARYWRSFGTLDIEVDATALNGTYKINFTGTDTIPESQVSHWHFTEIPVQDLFIINYIPSINKLARILIVIGPEIIALFLSISLIILHIIYTIRYRTAHPYKKYSPVVIVGSIVLPVIFCTIFILSIYFTDWIIGEFASGRHGYLFLIFFLYPVIMPIYWIIMWLIDRSRKQKLQTKTR